MSFNSRFQDRIESSTKSAEFNNPFRQDHRAAQGYANLKAEKRRHRTDSIETPQQRLEREMVHRFQNNYFQLPKGQFLLVAQLGQFFILAIALPPYILFYGAPKWVISQLLSALSPLAKKGSEEIVRLYHFLSGWKNNLFSLFSNRMRMLSSKFKFNKGNFSFREKSVFKVLNRYRAAFFQKVNNKRERFRNFTNRFNKFLSNQKNRLKKIPELSKVLIYQLQQIVTSRIKEIQRSSINLFKTKQKNLKKKIDVFQTYLKNRAKGISQPVKKIIAHRLAPLVVLAADVRQSSLQAIHFLVHFTKETLHLVEKKIKGFSKPLTMLTQMALGLKNWVKNLSFPSLFSLNIFYSLGERFQKITHAMILKVNIWKKETAEKLQRVLNIFRAFKPFEKRIWIKISDKMRKNYSYLQQKTRQASQAIKKGKEWLQLQARLAPYRLFNLLKRFIFWVYKILEKIGSGIWVGLTWVKVFISHSIRKMESFLYQP